MAAKILVFAGTTEGRELVEALNEYKGLCVHSCVATEYGNSLLTGENIHVGRLSALQMEVLFEKEKFDTVIDATHPYAVEVSSNIKAACNEKAVKYLRLLRDIGIDKNDDIVRVESTEAAVKYLNKTKGKVLVTTGSKELKKYKDIDDFSKRIFVRVLPSTEAIEACIQLGLEGKHLLCMQGPFDFDMNKATLSWLDCKYMVTKDSGKEGGVREKIEAAKALGVTSIVIGRPQEKGGMNKEEMMSEICAMAGLENENAFKDEKLHIEADRDWFPLFVNIKAKRILIVGGGRVALRRAQSLLKFSCEVRVIGKEICPQLKALKNLDEKYKSASFLKLEEREFQNTDICGVDWVIAATNKGELNEKIGVLCKKRSIAVNIADNKEQCAFFFPGIVTEGNLTIGITAQGKDHGLVKEAAERIRRELSWQREK